MSLSCACPALPDDLQYFYGDLLLHDDDSPPPVNLFPDSRCENCKSPRPLSLPLWELQLLDADYGRYGDDPPEPRALLLEQSLWLCERCGDLAASLDDLGFCWQDCLGEENLFCAWKEYMLNLKQSAQKITRDDNETNK